MSNLSFPKRLDRKTVYESDWVTLYLDKVEMPNGYIIDTYHNLHYPNECVCVVIFNEKDEVLLIQSKRYITDRLEWEVPAGRMEDNETPEEAARRECLEESGCMLKDLTYLCCENPTNGTSDMKVHVFGAKVAAESSDIDENEVSAKQWVSREHALRMLKNNETQCGVTMLALLYAFLFYD